MQYGKKKAYQQETKEKQLEERRREFEGALDGNLTKDAELELERQIDDTRAELKTIDDHKVQALGLILRSWDNWHEKGRKAIRTFFS